MAISNAELTTIPANVYVSSGSTVISTMYFVNTSGSAATFNVWLMPTGNDTANVLNQVYSLVQLAPNETFVVDMEKLVLGNGDMIQSNASSNTAINTTLSYASV